MLSDQMDSAVAVCGGDRSVRGCFGSDVDRGREMPVEFPTVTNGNAGWIFFAWTESTGKKPAMVLFRAGEE